MQGGGASLKKAIDEGKDAMGLAIELVAHELLHFQSAWVHVEPGTTNSKGSEQKDLEKPRRR